MTDSIQVHDYGANEYDQSAKDYEWHGHEIIFGMCHEYLKPNTKLLDIGIGTGLSSEYFAKAGMEITGLDGSSEMLKQCEQKQFVQKLIQHDITKTPWPLKDNSFDFVISIGVFHFFEDIEAIFREVSRVIQPNGIFALQILDPNDSPESNHAKPVKKKIEGYEANAHPLDFTVSLLNQYGFEKLKQVGFLAIDSPESKNEFLCRAIIAQKRGSL